MHRFQRPAYIADGFEDDCDDLVHRCTQVQTLSYEKFCNIWKEMDFVTIFHGRNATSELAELSEEVILIAKKYMVSTTSNFEESVAGLFLVYALLNLQPLRGFVALRLIPEDVPSIQRIERIARQNRRYDVLYILSNVLIKGPCQCHVAQRERGMERSIKKYFDSYTPADDRGERPRGVFFGQTEESDLLKELGRLGTLYKDAKKALAGPNGIEKSLNYVNDDLMRQMDASLKKLVYGIYDNDSSSDSEGSEESPALEEHPQSIKERAMKSAVKGVRHLTGIADRSSAAKSTTLSQSSSHMNSTKRTMARQIAAMLRVNRKANESGSDAAQGSQSSLPELEDGASGPSAQSQDNNRKSKPAPSKKQPINNERRAQYKVAKNAMKRKEQIKVELKNKKTKTKSYSDSSGETTDEDISDVDDDDEEGNDSVELQADSVPIVIDKGAPEIEIELIGFEQKEDGVYEPVRPEEIKSEMKSKVRDKRELKKTRIKGMFQRLGMPAIANFKNSTETEEKK